jgi:predicted ATP-binding protein involved in virulence
MMRIKEIKIEKLFGMFNHSIELNLEEHLTIIYGINGIGKTMLFKILDNFFNKNFHKLIENPFEKLIIIYENNSYFELFNKKSEELNIDYYDEQHTKQINLSFGNVFFKNYKEKILKELRFRISEISENEFMLRETDEIIDYKELLERFSHLVEVIEIDKSLEDILSLTPLHFIPTQRLVSFRYEIDKSIPHRRELKSIKKEGIKECSQELAEIMKEKDEEHKKLTLKLDSSLIQRFMDKKVKIISDINELREENRKFEEKRSKFKSLGLLENIQYEKLIISDDIDESIKAVASGNIQDRREKLKIFDTLYEKLEIFLNILNIKRLSYKKLSIHHKKGFIFTNDNGDILTETDLSSGEQNEIVMFYELIFNVQENSLVLIDEPEISLHIVWQKEFLEDMKDILEIKKFDILIATHSPSIIDGNWDLTVKLEK